MLLAIADERCSRFTRMTTAVPPEDDAPEMPRFAPRLRRRTSERFRREDRRELRYLLSLATAVVCSWFVSLLPKLVRNWAADRIGDLWFRMAPTYRSHVFANIGQVLGPEVCDDAKMAMVRRIFRLSANNFADLLRAPHTSRSEMIRSVPLVDGSWTILDDAYARGQGVILLTAHLGSFDYIGHSLSARGYKLTSVHGTDDDTVFVRRRHLSSTVAPAHDCRSFALRRAAGDSSAPARRVVRLCGRLRFFPEWRSGHLFRAGDNAPPRSDSDCSRYRRPGRRHLCLANRERLRDLAVGAVRDREDPRSRRRYSPGDAARSSRY